MLNVRILDPAIARIYIISQLCLQYLLFCTKFLDKSVHSLRENIFNYQKKIQKLEELVEKRNEEIATLQRKVKRQDALNQPIFPCIKCTKNFLSAALLEAHVLRKHSHALVQEFKDKDSNLINTIKLELEIKQLKEKLNVTEKDLMEAESKPKDCGQCYQNAQRKFLSVAVQSNFEEKEKDDFEKDAVKEMLDEQMKQIEVWKHDEECRYRDEISELRTKLNETIEMLKERAASVRPPSPAPRRSTAEVLERKTDEVIWKDRYEELEKMHRNYQQQMTTTVSSIEKKYNEKVSQIADSVKLLKEENLSIRGELKKSEEKSAKIASEKPRIPITPKVITKICAQSSSSDDEEAIKPIPTPKLSFMQVKPTEIPKPTLETFSSQNFTSRSRKWKTQENLGKPDKRNTRDEAEILYLRRLDALGIPHHQQRMSKVEFNRVHTEMADIRDKNLKKNKSFFITRKKLQSKVQKIFQHRSKPNDELNDKDEKSRISVKEKSRVCVTDTTPQVEKFGADISKSPKTSTQAFRSDLEQVLERRLSAIGNVQESLQASSSKKNVKFNLNNLKESSDFVNEIRETNEDDSDFDITSFDTEAEDVGMPKSFKNVRK